MQKQEKTRGEHRGKVAGLLLLSASLVLLACAPPPSSSPPQEDLGGVEPITTLGPDFRNYDNPEEYAHALMEEMPELMAYLTGSENEGPVGTMAVNFQDNRYDCGIVTCSIWWNWGRTNWLYNQMKGAATETAVMTVAGAVCAVLGGGAIGGLACAGMIRARWQGLRDHLKHAVDTKTCSRWVFSRPTFMVGPTGPTLVTTLVGYNRWASHPNVNLKCNTPVK